MPIPEGGDSLEAYIAQEVERLAAEGLARERGTIQLRAQQEAERRMREREAELRRQQQEEQRIREAVTASLAGGGQQSFLGSLPPVSAC